MFVSNVIRVGCEIESPNARLPRIFYTISIKNTEQYVSEDPLSEEWSEIYVSEVLTDSTLEGWQPLGTNVFPLGLPRMRAQTLLKLNVYECPAGEERDKYPMILEAGGKPVERVEKILGRWSINFSASGAPDVDVLCDELRGTCTIFLGMRDGSRIYLVSPVVCVPGKAVENGKRQIVTLNDLQERVIAIHDLQRTWQRERQLCLQRKALCQERYGIDNDVSMEAEQDSSKQRAKYYILQQRKLDLMRSMDKDATSVEEIRAKQKVKLQALLNATQALVQAAGKVRSKKIALEGVGGQGTVDALGQQVESRRAIILSEIRKMYRVVRLSGHPQDPQQPQVENTMEMRWSGMGSQSLPSHQDTLDYSYTIRNCRVHDSTWKHAFDKDSHHYDDPDADRETRVALGYIAHMIVKISEYMDIPLRYPVTFRGSYSVIRDNYAGKEGIETPREFPLFCDSSKERPKYAIAVFLLNKDIVQVLSHLSFLRNPHQQNMDGLVQNSPNHIAQNMYNLLTFYDS